VLKPNVQFSSADAVAHAKITRQISNLICEIRRACAASAAHKIKRSAVARQPLPDFFRPIVLKK
jgi:hypothetical protein